MAQYDLPIDALRAYSPSLAVPDDFDAFWASTLADARSHALDATFTPVDTGLTLVDTYDVTFRGFGGSPVKAWLHLPAGASTPLPAVVKYIGYGGGRGLPHERCAARGRGHAVLVMDTRGQGSSWSVGDTADPGTMARPSHPGS